MTRISPPPLLRIKSFAACHVFRPSVDSLHDIVMRIGGADLDEDVSVADNDRTAASPRYIVKRDLSCFERQYTVVHPLVVDVCGVLFWDHAH